MTRQANPEFALTRGPLRKYLERFARIVGQWADGIIYIDGFSGQRFIEDEREGLKASFQQLFGDNSYEQRIEGLQVFKEAERKAPKLSETIRADAKRRARETVSGQPEERWPGGPDAGQRKQRLFTDRLLAQASARLHERPSESE